MRNSGRNAHAKPGKVVVTGGGGHIGSTVVAYLLDQGYTVHAVDRAAPAAPVLAAANATEWTVADLADPELAAAIMDGADAIVHLAAIPHPFGHADHDVFRNNTASTFCVLDAAARAGVTRAIVASSISVLGLVFAPSTLGPPAIPISESSPLQVTDAYALSKQVDEATAQMIHRKWGMTVLVYRLPNVLRTERLRERGKSVQRHPDEGQRELWAYLHVDDAARSVRLGLEADVSGCHVLNVVASGSLGDVDVAALAARFYPGTRQSEAIPPGQTGYTTEKAERLLGFRSEVDWNGKRFPTS